MRTATVLIVIVLLCATAGFGYRIDEGKAADASAKLLGEILSVGSESVFPKEDIRDAVPGDVLTVHHPVTLEPSYGVVPVYGAGGRLIGIVGVDRSGEKWQWCSFSYPHGEFPLVPGESAMDRVRARKQSLGLDGEPGDGDGGDPILIQGCDKRLYWHLEDARGDTWLIDAMLEDAEVLGSYDGSARTALTPQKALYAPSEGGHGLLEQSDASGFALLSATPPAYNMPGIPYHFQITSWYCGPASLQMVMDYWGEEVNQHDIADVANDIVDLGTYTGDMRRAAHFSGMSTCIQDSSLHGYDERQLGYACTETYFGGDPGQQLKDTVYEQYPVFILTWFGPTHGAGHYRVVKGWDDGLSAFIMHDPWYSGSLCGPDLVMSETLLLDDLWVYSAYWAMVACPWEITPEIAASPAAGDTFSVDLQVHYPGPTSFSGQYACTNCEATIALPAGLSLASGTLTQALPNMASGYTTQVSWDIVAASPGDYSVALQAQGILSGGSGSYPSYSDTIGGHASETVTVGSTLLAGWENEEQVTSGVGSSLLCSPGSRSMVVGSTGEVHLVWSDTGGGTNDIYYMKRSGGAWGVPARINDVSGFSTTPCIAEGPDGKLHVAWVDGRNGNHEIYYNYWDAVGGWSLDERVTADSEVDYCPAIAAGDTAVYLAWERRMGGAYRVSAVHFSQRTALGGWTAPRDIDSSPAKDSYHPSIVYGPDKVVYIVYERQTASNPNELERIVMKSFNGLVWSGRQPVSEIIGFSRNPCVAAGSDTTLHLVWQDGDNVYGAIYYAYHDGLAWQPSIQVSPEAIEATSPSVAVDGSNVVHIVWSDHRHVDTEVYYSRWEDHLLVEGARLSTAPGHSVAATVAAGAVGGLCAVWSDLRNGTADLYFRSVDDLSGISVEGPAFGPGAGVRLASPSPNPFNSTTRIDFALARDARAIVQVFDVEGRLVSTLADGVFGAGAHSVAWNGRTPEGGRVAAGIYFIRCKSPIGEDVRRAVIAR